MKPVLSRDIVLVPEVKSVDSSLSFNVALKLSEHVPPWRVRLRRSASRYVYSAASAVGEFGLKLLLEPARMVREVGPNSKPLERHEFEKADVRARLGARY